MYIFFCTSIRRQSSGDTFFIFAYSTKCNNLFSKSINILLACTHAPCRKQFLCVQCCSVSLFVYYACHYHVNFFIFSFYYKMQRIDSIDINNNRKIFLDNFRNIYYAILHLPYIYICIICD